MKMKKITTALLEILTLSILTISVSLNAHAINITSKINKIIYGRDDRIDVYRTTPRYKNLAKSTAAMMERKAVNDNGVEAVISGITLEDMGLCSEQRFSKQLSAASCSGFLVAPDLLVTAGHCIEDMSDCKNNVWVFDFSLNEADSGVAIRTMSVPSSSVYNCQEIVSRELNDENDNDFALIKLDRRVTDRAPLKVRTQGRVSLGIPLVIIGHPSGVPTKIAGGANVVENSDDIFFQANLDSFGGNSGSPVFNAITGEVEGILVSGGYDYIMSPDDRDCVVPNRLPDDISEGEGVTRITNIEALMKLVK